uniref:Putative pectate lyase n=1 Tax=viral metagenome TaxID=1070528 RepID=A0A6M3M546_9ZZZZ
MTDYYVAPGGSNGWPGTIGQPWQTIGYAVTRIYADDTLWIRQGEYLSPSGGFQFANTGSSGHPVTVRNYPDESVIIRVNDQGIWYAPWVGNAEGSGPVVDYIHIIGSDIANRQLSCGIYSTKGIVVQGPDATYTDAPGVRVWNAAYWEVAGIDFVRMGYGLFGHTYDNDHFYVHDNRIIDSTRENHLQFNGPYHTIENNVLVRDRPDYHSPYGCYSLSLLAHGNTVKGNVIDQLQLLYYNSNLVDPGGILLEWDIADDNIIEGNIIRHMDVAIDFAGGDRNIIRNNILITGDYSHIDGGLYIRSYALPGPTWPCQNEWLVPGAGHPAYDMYYPHDCHSRDNEIYNNVFVGFNKAILFEGVVPDGETKIRNNAFVDCVDSVCTWSTCGTFARVTQSNSQEDPPFGFVNQGAEDFHLLETSLCKDAGYNLGSLVPDDFDGVSRPQGVAYDIGAFEYVPAAPTFPVVLSITPSSFNVNATPHLVAMPATVDAGDLLLALFSNDGGDVVTTPGGWGLVFSAQVVAQASRVRFGAYAKVAVGTEGGTTVNFVTSGTEMAAAQVYRIQAGTWWGALAGVEAATPSDCGSVDSRYPDPPSFAPSWGALDTLWVACYGADDDDAATGYPGSYTDGTYTPSGTATGSCSLASARRELNATSDDPSNFTIAAVEEWVANTIAVRPVGTGPTYYHGLKIQGVGELALCDVGTHPLRIRKGGTTYGVELVATADGNASKVRIQTPTGVKALRKYT